MPDDAPDLSDNPPNESVDTRQFDGVLSDHAYAGWRQAGLKVRQFQNFGRYLMKDDVGRVIILQSQES